VSPERTRANSESTRMKCKTIPGKFTTVRTTKLCGPIKEDSRKNIETIIVDHIFHRKEKEEKKERKERKKKREYSR